VKDANLRVLVLNGYYDLATPFSATEYVMAHPGLPPDVRSWPRIAPWVVALRRSVVSSVGSQL